MTALERKLIGMGLAILLTFALSLAADGTASWLFWPVMIVGAMLWHRVPVAASSSSTPATLTSAYSHSEQTCSGVWDGDLGDCTW